MTKAQRRRCPAGFTLAEMLVAIAVLAVLIGVLLEMSTSTLSVTSQTHARIKADEAAREVLDAMAADLLNLITQNAAPVLVGQFQDSSTGVLNTQFSFLTQGRGPNTTTRCLAVSYGLAKGNLVRVMEPVSWSSNSTAIDDVLKVANDAASALNTLETTGSLQGSTSTEILDATPNILRFVAVASLSDGTMASLTPPPNETWTASSLAGESLGSMVALNVTDTTQVRVRNVILGVGAVDDQSYHLLSSTGHLTTVGSNLTLPSIGQTPLGIWEAAIEGGASWNSVPRPVLAALQVVQRTYPLPQ